MGDVKRHPKQGHMTFVECHNELGALGFEPVPGSSRYETRIEATSFRSVWNARIVAGPGSGDTWYTEIWQVSYEKHQHGVQQP